MPPCLTGSSAEQNGIEADVVRAADVDYCLCGRSDRILLLDIERALLKVCHTARSLAESEQKRIERSDGASYLDSSLDNGLSVDDSGAEQEAEALSTILYKVERCKSPS